MALQALVYGQSVDTREFIDSAHRSAQTQQVRALIAAIHARMPV
jgi:hypothetical protein